MKKIIAALVGNPNSGKTTVFNMLTGANQKVGNYPGVTVEKVEGTCTYGDFEIRLVDLPGTYSLAALSEEEVIARDFLTHEKPDVVINVVDSSNLERNLYLTTQLIEMDQPLVLSFNMSDIAKRKGINIDFKQLSILFEAPIVETVGAKEIGCNELLKAIIWKAIEQRKTRLHQVKYGIEIDGEIEKLTAAIILDQPGIVNGCGARWMALKLIEADENISGMVASVGLAEKIAKCRGRLKERFGDEPEILIAERRFGFIQGACRETICHNGEARHSKSDLIDSVVTNRYLSLPIFLVFMYVVFFLTFKIGAYPMAWLESFFQWSAVSITAAWPQDSYLLVRSLLVDGIIGGVGGVLVFLPNILLLFGAIALLEATGYMARAAFIMDRLMHKIGLHGKSFIPMLIGFGCSVPAIMATRILDNRRNRLTTMMVLPLMSCGARLTIYSLFIPAFFAPNWRGPVLWIMYIIGIILAVLAAKILRLTIFKGETIPFVMELPPYRMPTMKSLVLQMWQRAWLYLKKAGTVILVASMIFWAMTQFPQVSEEKIRGLSHAQAVHIQLSESLIGRIGIAIEPIVKPLGFDWKIATALISATAAKELFVSQLSVIYSAGDETVSLASSLRENYSALTGFCVMLFCLISAPCLATIAVTRHESGSWLLAVSQFIGLTILGYIVTFAVYQVGMLFV